MCGLESHADAIVGSLGVEYKKRTTIGVELAAKVTFLSTALTLCLTNGGDTAEIAALPG